LSDQFIKKAQLRLLEVRRPAVAPGQPKLQAVLEAEQTWQHVGLPGGFGHQQANLAGVLDKWGQTPFLAFLAAVPATDDGSTNGVRHHFTLKHVLPTGFKRIRHYGLLAPKHKVSRLALARAALDAPTPDPLVIASVAAFMQGTNGGRHHF
jgi:hypothetical protein